MLLECEALTPYEFVTAESLTRDRVSMESVWKCDSLSSLVIKKKYRLNIVKQLSPSNIGYWDTRNQHVFHYHPLRFGFLRSKHNRLELHKTNTFFLNIHFFGQRFINELRTTRQNNS